MKYLKLFKTTAEYEAYIADSENFVRPNVSLCEDDNSVYFHDFIPEIDYSKEYFTIEALEDGTVEIGIPSDATSLKYRKNDEAWIETSEAIQVSVVANDTIQMSCVSDKWESQCSSPFNISASFNVKGNIMSLLYGDDFENQIDLSGRDYVFNSLFYQCTTLQSAENLILPAITLAESCYYNMFNGCTSLTTAPELPATTLASRCYNAMFLECTSLTEAPELPATTLVDYCYEYMFQGCKSLTTAPQLRATTLVSGCYGSMFNGCSKLNYIKMLATNISASSCLYYWVNGVASSGTFVKNTAMTSLPSGISGIPKGWTVEDYEG